MFTPRSLRLVLAAVSVIGLLSLGGLIALIVLWHKKLTPFEDYAVVIDAGSTHSKIFLYRWPADKSDGLGTTSRVYQKTTCAVGGGAITSITNPSENTARQYFDSAMSSCVNEIPSTRRNRALLFLGATAGLRLTQMKNPTYTNALLNSTRTYFSTLGLLFKAPENQVRIISGTEEGLSGWISTNMLTGELYKNNNPQQTYGVSDMGGASTQISFISPNATGDRSDLNLFNTEYDVYSHSFLCYGAERFRFTYLANLVNQGGGGLSLNDPCLQRDYSQSISFSTIFDTPCAVNQYAPSPSLNTSSTYTFTGTGDSGACTAAVKARLDTSFCNRTTCSFDNVYQPKPIPASLRFIAMSAWYSTFNSLAPNVSLAKNPEGNYDFDSVNFTRIKSAIAAVCQQSWLQLNTTDQFRPLLCFNSMYHWTLLEYGYGMTDVNLKNFHIVKTIDSNDIGWTLGYMINQTNDLSPEFRPGRLLTKAEFGGLLALCGILLLASIIIVITLLGCFRQRLSYN